MTVLSIMLCVANKLFMLSVVKQTVITLSVVVPSKSWSIPVFAERKKIVKHNSLNPGKHVMRQNETDLIGPISYSVT